MDSEARKEVILVVEDDLNDVFFIRRAVALAGLDIDIMHLREGQQAINYLRQAMILGQGTTYPMPRLVLLDIKMPKVDGFDVLQWIRSEPQLVNLEVVILSSSDHPQDLSQALLLGANKYILKKPMLSGLPLQLMKLLSK